MNIFQMSVNKFIYEVSQNCENWKILMDFSKTIFAQLRSIELYEQNDMKNLQNSIVGIIHPEKRCIYGLYT